MKNVFSSSFYQRVFFCQFGGRNVVGLNAKVLPACSNAGDEIQDYISFVHKIKNEQIT